MFARFATPRRLLGTAAVLTFAAAPLAAQSVAEHIALGDRDRAAMQAPSALRHYEDAIKLDPRSYEALVKATREAVDVGEYNPDEKERDRLYTMAEQYARRAVDVNPADAEGHFSLALALGRKALSLGKRDQVRYAGDVRTAALDALRINGKHPGALHVMGKWNYEVLQLSGMTRFFAKTFLGGRVFDSANWDDAQRYLEQAVEIEPNRLIHHLDLARVYVARGNKDKAREQFDLVIKGTPAEYNDRRYQAEAADEMRAL
jgi:tetratricopeptide (TPR) repeat protein